MAARTFISRCKRTLNDCARLLETHGDPEPSAAQSAIMRLETMERSLGWARGRLIDGPIADGLIQDLQEYIAEAQRSLPSTSAQQGYQAPLVSTGGRGPPQYAISRDQLKFLRTCGFTAPQMAELLKVSVRTVRRRLRQFHLKRMETYSTLSDEELQLGQCLRDYAGERTGWLDQTPCDT